MTRLAANLCFLFAELPFLDRFAAARASGFDHVEFTFVYDIPPAAIAAECQAHRLKPVLLNAPAGNLTIGEAGLAALAGREAEMRGSFATALDYAERIGIDCIHVLAGNVGDDVDRKEAEALYIRNLRWAGALAAARGVIVTIEPLNPRDRPNYFLRTCGQAIAILEQVGLENVRLQFDVYHHLLTEGDPVVAIPRLVPWMGHAQIAGIPDRHEPDPDTMDYESILATLDRYGYRGSVGCEYLPMTETVAGLGWAEPYLNAASMMD